MLSTSYDISTAPARDLMREYTRSRIQDWGRQMRSANTVPFPRFNIDFRLEADVQESSCWVRIHAISNMTGSVLFWCWAVCECWRKMRERTWYDALTYTASKQRMRERTLRCANERFLVPTNEYRLLASLLFIYKSVLKYVSAHALRLKQV